MPRPAYVIVLVEGKLDEQFILGYLRRLGLKKHDWRISKTALGSGEQWVRKQFPIEVAAYRRRAAATKLVVIIDADTHTVQQRLAQLNNALHEANVAPINDDYEAIARLIPKRNIETWILCENGITVDQIQDYKGTRNDWTELIRTGADFLYSWTRPNAAIPESCVDSLKIAIPQLQKLDP